MLMDIQTSLFYGISALLIISAVMVVATRHPIRSVLFLVFSFITSAMIWMMLQSEFLALVLIFVYVGAVMTLFMFIVMMLNAEKVTDRSKTWRYFPVVAALMALFTVISMKVLKPSIFGLDKFPAPAVHPASYSSAHAIGAVLYTDYALSFELAALLLLVAIIAAISLCFRGPREGKKTQNIRDQVKVTKADRLKLVDLKGVSK